MSCEDQNPPATEYAALNDRQAARISELEQELADLKAYNSSRTDEIIAAIRCQNELQEVINVLNKKLEIAIYYLDEIKWTRPPGGSPKPYEYKIEVLADKALSKINKG